MEDYNKKVNYGSKESPIWRDRLVVNQSNYGYRLFDRTIKKNLLSQKSELDCIYGKKKLLEGDLDAFNKFKEEIKDKALTENKIIVFKSKHFDNYYNISTYDQLKKVALLVLEQRMEANYIQKWNLPEPLDYKEEDIDSMPESFQKDAIAKMKRYKQDFRENSENNKVFDMVHKAISEKNGELAWHVLQLRNGYEYETYEIIEPTSL